jgi:uncharacterized protein YggE
MKSVRGILAIAVFAISALLLISSVWSGVRPVAAQTQTPLSRTIAVVGIGTVYTAPDIAYLHLGVNVQNPDLAAALKEADTKMNAIVQALKDAGVAEADIQTVQYNVFLDNPMGGPQPGNASNAPQNYHAVNVARITVRTTSKVGDLLNAAVKAGANQINNVEFGVKDTKASESAARKAALEDARTRATELAASMGGTLGQIISIEEGNAIGTFPRPFAAEAGGGGGGGPAISSGSLQVSVNLLVTFEVK